MRNSKMDFLNFLYVQKRLILTIIIVVIVSIILYLGYENDVKEDLYNGDINCFESYLREEELKEDSVYVGLYEDGRPYIKESKSYKSEKVIVLNNKGKKILIDKKEFNKIIMDKLYKSKVKDERIKTLEYKNTNI